jgi:hypothetical protein
MTARVPPDALIVLDSMLDSFEKLELAWYLTRANAPVPRTELQAALRLNADALQEVLADLRATKIVEISGGPEPVVRLGLRAQGDDFRSLMAVHAEDPVAIVAALSSIATRRIRTMAARTFVLKKRGKGNDD